MMAYNPMYLDMDIDILHLSRGSKKMDLNRDKCIHWGRSLAINLFSLPHTSSTEIFAIKVGSSMWRR